MSKYDLYIYKGLIDRFKQGDIKFIRRASTCYEYECWEVEASDLLFFDLNHYWMDGAVWVKRD